MKQQKTLRKMPKTRHSLFGLIAILTVVAAITSFCRKSADFKTVTDVVIVRQSEKVEDHLGETMRTIQVVVQNNDENLQEYIQVKAVWYDAVGKVVGTATGSTTNLAAKNKRVIALTGLNIEAAQGYKLFLETSTI